VVDPSGFPEGIAEEDPEEGSGQVLREEVGGQGGVEQGGRVALMGIVLVDVADWSAHFFSGVVCIRHLSGWTMGRSMRGSLRFLVWLDFGMLIKNSFGPLWQSTYFRINNLGFTWSYF